jgi:hypothetical protein
MALVLVISEHHLLTGPRVDSMITKELQMEDLEALVQPVLTLAAVVAATQVVEVVVCKHAVVVTHKLEVAAGLTQLSALLHRALRIQVLDTLQLVNCNCNQCKMSFLFFGR